MQVMKKFPEQSKVIQEVAHERCGITVVHVALLGAVMHRFVWCCTHSQYLI